MRAAVALCSKELDGQEVLNPTYRAKRCVKAPGGPVVIVLDGPFCTKESL
jgi:hypothetical protein